MRIKNVFKTLIIIITILFLYLFGRKYCFLHITISDSYKVRQRPFTKNYVLFNSDNEKLLEHIFEWSETPEILYGSGEDYYFILSKQTNTLAIYNDQDTDEYIRFNADLNLYGYKYSIDSCVRVIDYSMR